MEPHEQPSGRVTDPERLTEEDPSTGNTIKIVAGEFRDSSGVIEVPPRDHTNPHYDHHQVPILGWCGNGCSKPGGHTRVGGPALAWHQSSVPLHPSCTALRPHAKEWPCSKEWRPEPLLGDPRISALSNAPCYTIGTEFPGLSTGIEDLNHHE